MRRHEEKGVNSCHFYDRLVYYTREDTTDTYFESFSTLLRSKKANRGRVTSKTFTEEVFDKLNIVLNILLLSFQLSFLNISQYFRRKWKGKYIVQAQEAMKK